MMASGSFVPTNVSGWIEENKDFFLPPVSNKLMHDYGQINVMFVGGPNQRKDFHIEAGEELFYQLKGDMVLKVMERGRHKDIVIKEGEIFLLPNFIPHSPQRFANTVGLVIERQRLDHEYDMLRYFVETDGKLSPEILYDMTFHWGVARERMPEFFKRFFNSEEYKTGRPLPGTLTDPRALTVDSLTNLQDPFNLREWLSNNRQKINIDGKLAVFDLKKNQLQVFVYGKGENSDCTDVAETWIWQLEGNSVIKTGDENFKLNQDDSLLIPVGQKFTVKQDVGSFALVCYQDPRKASST
jgi:3-hydroxyanthranilate 3,4-dioxygenase